MSVNIYDNTYTQNINIRYKNINTIQYNSVSCWRVLFVYLSHNSRWLSASFLETDNPSVGEDGFINDIKTSACKRSKFIQFVYIFTRMMMLSCRDHTMSMSWCRKVSVSRLVVQLIGHHWMVAQLQNLHHLLNKFLSRFSISF